MLWSRLTSYVIPLTLISSPVSVSRILAQLYRKFFFFCQLFKSLSVFYFLKLPRPSDCFHWLGKTVDPSARVPFSFLFLSRFVCIVFFPFQSLYLCCTSLSRLPYQILSLTSRTANFPSSIPILQPSLRLIYQVYFPSLISVPLGSMFPNCLTL